MNSDILHILIGTNFFPLFFSTDYVYFETSSSLPYQIRRIEELNKTPSGNVEAKVMCFYRRRDLPISLVQLADKHQSKSSFNFFFFVFHTKPIVKATTQHIGVVRACMRNEMRKVKKNLFLISSHIEARLD